MKLHQNPEQIQLHLFRLFKRPMVLLELHALSEKQITLHHTILGQWTKFSSMKMLKKLKKLILMTFGKNGKIQKQLPTILQTLQIQHLRWPVLPNVLNIFIKHKDYSHFGMEILQTAYAICRFQTMTSSWRNDDVIRKFKWRHFDVIKCFKPRKT